MDDSIRRLAHILGATELEGGGGVVTFLVNGADGGKMKVRIESAQQRFMAVLQDAKGVTRADVNIAPVKSVREDPSFPGRIILFLGAVRVQVDSKPSLAIEVLSTN